MPSIALVPVKFGDDSGGTLGIANGFGVNGGAAVCPSDGPADDRDPG